MGKTKKEYVPGQIDHTALALQERDDALRTLAESIRQRDELQALLDKHRAFDRRVSTVLGEVERVLGIHPKNPFSPLERSKHFPRRLEAIKTVAALRLRQLETTSEAHRGLVATLRGLVQERDASSIIDELSSDLAWAARRERDADVSAADQTDCP